MIVFEVSSCSWQDDIMESNKSDHDYSLNDFDCLGEKEALFLRSFILRKQYGGMECDMTMLDEFYMKWNRRFQEGAIDNAIAKRCTKGIQHKWIDMPTLLHKYSIERSSNQVTALISGDKPLLALSLHDISPSGIDFHCSSILDSILNDRTVYTELKGELNSELRQHLSSIDENESNLKEAMMSILKRLMWTFSSGVNFRQLISGEKKQLLNQLPLYTVWQQNVDPHVKRFASSYITYRLNKNCS